MLTISLRVQHVKNLRIIVYNMNKKLPYKKKQTNTKLSTVNVSQKYGEPCYDESIIQKVRDIIVKKYDNVEIYTVNPTIDDIIENNIFKLDIGGKIYFVPLWHSELLFEKPDKNDLIVKCIPNLPENITIDENNNVIVVINVTFSYSLFDMGNIEFFIGKKRYVIPLDCLKVTPIQQYVFYNKGITKINWDNIYNVEDCGDVIAMIHFVY